MKIGMALAVFSRKNEACMKKQQQVVTTCASQALTSDRRTGLDRRRHSWRTILYCGLHGRGRRRSARRKGHNYYLDWYDPKLVYMGLAVLILSSMDALFTLNLLQMGAYEANILMDHLIQTSDRLFVITKLSITALSVLFLVMHANFQLLGITNGGRVLQWIVPLYVLLIIYELLLMGWVL
jgi:hypothetical protein